MSFCVLVGFPLQIYAFCWAKVKISYYNTACLHMTVLMLSEVHLSIAVEVSYP